MHRLSPDHERTSIGRRTLLIGGVAGAINCAVPLVARAATALVLPNAAANRRFSVRYKDIKIGTHTVSYSSATAETRVKTEINLEVKVAFLTAYAFSHRSEEIWRAGRLMSLNSDTVEHGETLHVEGAATPQGFRIVSKGGPFIASAATLTSNSLWTPGMLERVEQGPGPARWRLPRARGSDAQLLDRRISRGPQSGSCRRAGVGDD
jgi:Family of unknown function (DUF6134)